MKKNIIIVLLFVLSVNLFSQGMQPSEGMGMGIGLSNQNINGLNYQSIALMPELNLGFFGIGLNVDLRFTLKISAEGEPAFEILQDDWIIEDGTPQEYLSLYLAKIAYIRLGQKDENFYLKAGQFNRATLGNGSILSDYSNMQFLPETRVFGLALDIDGALFNFPYIGFESFVGNIAAVDVLGGRLYTRPFKALSIPVLSNVEIAASGVIDRDPYFYNSEIDSSSDDLVSIYGVDVTIPFIDTPIFGLNIYGDMVFQNESSAQIYGLGGKVISLINYKLEYINQKENYIADYFNASYDLNRTSTNFDIYHGNISDPNEIIPAKQDMAASLGFEIPKILYFDARLTGILSLFDTPALSAEEAPQLYPSLKGTLHIDDEILKIVSADFFYLKNGMDSFNSIIDPTNAIIGGSVSYYQGNMVVSFIVDVKYNGDAVDNIDTTNVDESVTEQWITNTQIAVNFKL